MKTLISFLSLTIFSLFFFLSCKQQSEVVENNYEIINALKIIENYNEGKYSHEKASLINGAVEIITTQNEIVLFVTENGKQDLMYVLQQDPSLPRLQLRESISNAQILFFHRILLINSLDKDLRLFFNVDDELPTHLSGIELGKTSFGYGLVYQPGVKLIYDSIEDFHGVRTIYEFRKDVEKNQAGVRTVSVVQSVVECGCCNSHTTETVCVDMVSGYCDSGGSGSTSCSITTTSGASCQTSCSNTSSGACCNDTSNDTEGG